MITLNKTYLISGKKGSGKSTFTDNENPKFPPGLIQNWMEKRKGRPDEKVLVIDTVDHPHYRKYQIIQARHIPAWKKGIKRIIVNEPIFKKEVLPMLHSHLYNCMVVYEDSTKYIRNDEKISDELNSFITDSKQKNIDQVFIYHSIGMSNIDICRLTDIVVLFKSLDPPEGAKFGKIRSVVSAYNEVMADPDPFAKRIVEIN